MAFTNSPQLQTYKTLKLKFDGTDMFRSGDMTIERDLQIVNMYYDRVSQENETREIKLKKRPGLTTTSYSLSKNSASDVLRGSYYDVDQNAFYWAVGDKIYSISPDAGTSVRTVTTLTTTDGYVGFTSYLKSDGTRYVMISDGTDLWYDDWVATTCLSIPHAGNFPSPHQPSPIYLDGYIFLIKTGTGDIFNSVVDDVTTWTGESITAEIFSDVAVKLLKAKNYLVCLGTKSAEYFWDAGNEAPTSPLSRNDSPVRSVGYVTGFCTIGDTTYFVGQDDKQNLGVFAINSFKIEQISNSVVNRTLQVFSSTANTKGSVTLDKDGFSIDVDGNMFYVLTTPQTTWVYSIKDKFWYEWKNSAGTGLQIEAVWTMFNGAVYVAIANQTTISILSPKIYRDFGVDFTCRYTTENATFDTFNWKVLHRVALNASMHQNTGTSNVTLTWSTDDWASGSSSGPRNINIFGSSPYTSRLGRFRNISFRFEYADDYPFFMTGMEVDLNVMGI